MFWDWEEKWIWMVIGKPINDWACGKKTIDLKSIMIGDLMDKINWLSGVMESGAEKIIECYDIDWVLNIYKR